MKVSYLHISYILHHSCKIHAFSHIFFEHFYDFKTHIYVQIKIKNFKNRVFVKILQIRYLIIFSIFIFEISSYEFCFFQNLITFFFSIFEFDYIVFFFYEKKRFHMKKKKNLFRHFVIRHSKLEFIEYRDMKHEIYIILNIADYR